jgi:Flp pilus assembly pilin Flp
LKVVALLLKDENRVAAIKYALTASLIAFAAIGAFTFIVISLSGTFTTIANKLY